MKIPFTKMHGAGNDYIYVNCMDGLFFDPADLAVKMSPRHFSVGSDGLVLIMKSDVADARMRMFNADGSEGKMCGNAIRCVGKYLSDNGYVTKDDITIETLSGIKTLAMHKAGGVVRSVTVDMGVASFRKEDVPVLTAGAEMIDEKVVIAGEEYHMTAVSMGNPHAVIFTTGVKDLDLAKMGHSFEHFDRFPERVNTEFVEVVSPTHLIMRVWERGSGETFACGTGASATVAAAVRNGISPRNEDVTVTLLGGDLTIKVDNAYRVAMTGPATTVYEGVYEYDEDQGE